MFIAVDDTDSRSGMCTTYLLTELIRRSKLDVIGFPRLVRLNPAIKYKTRGNGALAVNLAVGKKRSILIGDMDGRDLWCYQDIKEEPNAESLLNLAGELVEEMAELDSADTNPGVVVAGQKFPEGFYWKTVREETSIGTAEKFITENHGEFLKFKNGRGIIGAAAAISWPEENKTFELLAYKFPHSQSMRHELKLEIAENCCEIHGTFNNIDRKNQYPAVFPKERTPVIMGIRGVEPNHIYQGFKKLNSRHAIQQQRFIVFSTNQATDDHIIPFEGKLVEGQSYSIMGEVISTSEPIRGSHYFSSVLSHGLRIGIAAFEPTKEFRSVFRNLIPGDQIQVYGTYQNKVINVEKMEITSLASLFSRQNPVCDGCGKTMHSKGFGDYRCPECGDKKSIPAYSRIKRDIRPGRYDVPVIARRHLSRPFDLGYSFTGKEKEVLEH